MALSPPPSSAVLLSISIVSFQPDPEQFRMLLQSLARAVSAVREQWGDVCETRVVDHSATHAEVATLCAPFQADLSLTLMHDPANPGFGAGHNRCIRDSQAPFHLILNPDVILPRDSLVTLLRHLDANPQVVLLGPEVRNGHGQLQFPCKEEPTVLDLALRGFAPAWLRDRFDARLARYECRDLTRARQPAVGKYLSGCFLLGRTAALQAVGGFDEGYFLYFEDFALSRALRAHGDVQYFPEVYVVHHGGGAGRKGLAHIRFFAASAWRWFGQYGWRLW